MLPASIRSIMKYVAMSLAKAIGVLLVIFAALVVALLTAMWVLAKGPSPTARDLFVLTVKETSAMGWLADMYLSEAEIESIIKTTEQEETYETDTSLVTVQSARPQHSVEVSAEGSASDGQNSGQEEADDGDGIELVEIFGTGYRGYMMIVADPTRLYVGTPDNYGGRGLTLDEMVEREGAIAGINAGGFQDINGGGTGGEPDGIVVCNGALKYNSGASFSCVIGFDAEGILHVGYMTPYGALSNGLQWAVSFGPILISNGEIRATAGYSSISGINPRTAIGQRADGAVLLLVVEGRQVGSLGASFEDLVEIFLDFGAVNAANLDGGSSSLMIYNGEHVSNPASVVGPRALPTSFLVSDVSNEG